MSLEPIATDAPLLEGKPATLSAELFTIPLGEGEYIMYAPLRRAAFVANSRLVNVVADLQSGGRIRSDSPHAGVLEFLRRVEIADAPPETRPITDFSGAPTPTALTLFLTTGCNLRCAYCYASSGETSVKRMSREVARRGIDFVVANARKKGQCEVEIAYHGGGEPTSHWTVMTDSLRYAREEAGKFGLSVKAAAATNGVLADNQIDWIIENLNGGVSVSFDGLPEAHDKHRRTLSGKGSSERVIRTMRRFDEAGYAYGLRLTVTAEWIARLPESIEYICGNFQPARIQVEPAYQLGRWADAATAETEEFIAAYREAQRRAGETGREIEYSGARVDALTNHFCGVSQDLFALTPDGNVSACYEAFSEEGPLADVFFYARPAVDSPGYVFDLPTLENLRGQSVERRAFCSGCFAKWHCAGDCLHKSLTVNGRGEFCGSDRCHIARELTKDQLLARIAASGGVFWHEPDFSDA